MSIKLFVSDLDGTMLPHGKTVATENIEAVRRAGDSGIVVSIATGRMYRTAYPVAKSLGIDVPIISYNGSVIKTTEGKIYEENFVDKDVVADIVEFCRQKNWYIQLYSDDNLYYVESSAKSDFYEESQQATGVAVGWKGLFKLVAGNAKLLLISSGREETEEWEQAIKERFGYMVDITSSNANFVEILPKGVSKASALRKLAGFLDVDILDTMAIGDAHNDLSMLRAAGKGIAMGNAVPEVKSVADYETLTCEEHGLAMAIYRYAMELPDSDNPLLKQAKTKTEEAYEH